MFLAIGWQQNEHHLDVNFVEFLLDSAVRITLVSTSYIKKH
jgi:hypothetical protein